MVCRPMNPVADLSHHVPAFNLNHGAINAGDVNMNI